VIRTNTLSPAKENHLATADLGSRKEARSAWALTERPACFEIEPRGVRSSAPIRIWVSDAAHHCVQLRIDLLFTMSDNLHRGDRRDQRDTNSSAWTSNGAGDFSPAFAQASAGNLRGSKAGLPTEAALAAKVGGARRNRTDDLLLAKQALSQLSYGPSRCRRLVRMVGLGRFELPTSRLSSARSNQLSYKPGPGIRCQ
jgi:hypothetical protein